MGAGCELTSLAAGSGPRVVLFAHAGASVHGYRPLARRLGGVEVLGCELPGRGRLHQRPPFPDLAAAARDCARQIADLPDRPTVFVGHSFGARLALRVAQAGAGDDPFRLRRLVVSGAAAPGAAAPRHAPPTDDALFAWLRRLGRSAAILDDPDLRRTFLPAIRSDLAALADDACGSGAPAPAPITVLLGRDDPEVSPDEARGWSACGQGEAEIRVLPGDHFFLQERPEAALALRDVLARSLLGRASTPP